MSELATNYKNQKIQGLVFSKDRAAQLDLFLRSAAHFAPTIEFTVLYDCGHKYQMGYDKVQSRHPTVKFVEEEVSMIHTSFCEQTKSVIKGDTTAFFTDDTVWIRPFNLTNVQVSQFLKDRFCFSIILRNGLNTKVQRHYPPIEYQKQPRLLTQDVIDENNIFTYNFREHSWETDFGRPFSLDGSIHLSEEILKVLNTYEWNGPRQLDEVNNYRGEISGMTAIPEHSYVVNMPINLTAEGTADNWGHYHRYSLEELEQKFVGGEIIRMDQHQYQIVCGHQEFPLVFDKE